MKIFREILKMMRAVTINCESSLPRLIQAYTQINYKSEQEVGMGSTTNSLHEGSQFSWTAEMNHAPGSYVYTMGNLYGEKATWRMKQLLRSS